jgi:hypothetical protein
MSVSRSHPPTHSAEATRGCVRFPQVCQTSLFIPFFYHYVMRFVRAPGGKGSGATYARVSTVDEDAEQPNSAAAEIQDEWAAAAAAAANTGVSEELRAIGPASSIPAAPAGAAARLDP